MFIKLITKQIITRFLNFLHRHLNLVKNRVSINGISFLIILCSDWWYSRANIA